MRTYWGWYRMEDAPMDTLAKRPLVTIFAGQKSTLLTVDDGGRISRS